jgi:dTDP-4-dehydrorhamnose 3,5-epimerase-like enzyme
MEGTTHMKEIQATHAWKGLNSETRRRLKGRDYRECDPLLRLAESGMTAGELLHQREFLDSAWIPGVEVFPRAVHQQEGRGHFSELTRLDSGTLDRIGLMPRQWSAAMMHGHSCKGFHIHPPHVPSQIPASLWFRDLFLDHPGNYGRRPYDREQWDVMFFLRGICEILLVDERAGLDRRIMRFTIWGDHMPGPNNAAVVIPAGVAHALRALSQDEVILVYGTSTTFDPLSEGRIASNIESPSLPQEWEDYLTEPR